MGRGSPFRGGGRAPLTGNSQAIQPIPHPIQFDVPGLWLSRQPAYRQFSGFGRSFIPRIDGGEVAASCERDVGA